MAQARLQANPRLPPRRPWFQSVEKSNQDAARSVASSRRAFVGFVHPYSSNRPVPGVGRSGVEGRRRSPLLCGDEVVKCCILNRAGQLEEALEHLQIYGDINCQADRGLLAHGAPFAFGTTAVWNYAQIGDLATTMQNTVVRIADLQQRYYTDGEWDQIRQHVYDIGNYPGIENRKEADIFDCASRGRFIFEGLVVGDSYMHLALRVSAVAAASVLLRGGLDPTLANSVGEAPPDLLEVVLRKLSAKLERVEQLKTQFVSRFLPELQSSELEELETEPALVAEWKSFHAFCWELATYFQQRSLEISALEHEVWRSKLEGLAVDDHMLRDIAQKSRIVLYMNLSRSMADRSTAEMRPGFEQEIAIPLEIQDELQTLSSLSFIEHDVQLDTWLRKLEIAAVDAQALWRGFRIRKYIHNSLELKATIIIQSRVRTFIQRARRWHRLRHAAATMLQRFERNRAAHFRILRLRERMKVLTKKEAKRVEEEAALRSEEAELARQARLPSFLRNRTLGHARTAKRLAKKYRSEESYSSASSYRAGLKKARRHYRDEYTIKRKLLGAVHEETLAALNNVATCDRKAGKMKRAARVYTKVLRLKRESMGFGTKSSWSLMWRRTRTDDGVFIDNATGAEPMAASYAISLVNLGNVYQNQYKVLRAMDCYGHALPLLEKRLGKMDPIVATCLFNDALCRMDRANKADFDAAINQLARVIGIYEKRYGLDSKPTQEAINELKTAKVRRANR